MAGVDTSKTADWGVIFNPVAGRGRAQKLQHRLIRLLETHPGTVSVQITRAAGHARELAAQWKDCGITVIAAGGDGTIHEVVNGLAGGNCTLGIIPLGSGNDFVKMLNLPADIAEAIAVIQRGKTMRIDLGWANGEYFPNSMGIGFDAEVVVESKKIQHVKGFWLYLAAVLKKLMTFRNRSVRLTFDGQVLEQSVFLITVGNGQYVGGGFRITPRARLDDGLLDVCVLRGLTLPETLRYLPRVICGRHLDLPQVRYFTATSVVVESALPLPLQLDGELQGTDLHRVEIKIEPQMLTIIHNHDEHDQYPPTP